jgi:hypothetical protein
MIKKKVLLRYFDCLPILISFVKAKAADGDKEAWKCLRLWDKARG